MYRGFKSKKRKKTAAVMYNLQERERTGIWKRLTLHCTACRSRFGRGFVPFARLTVL